MEDSMIKDNICNKKRLRKGSLGSVEQDEFIGIIIDLLNSFGGQQHRQRIINSVHTLYSFQFSAPDYELLKSQNPPKERWIHNIDWAKRKLVQQGVILAPSQSPYGVWILSDAAKEQAK
jgi:hypothetical protein